MNLAAARISDLAVPSIAPRVRVSACAPARARLDIVRDEKGFLALAPFWDDLLSRSATNTPFLTWDWVSLWWEQYHDEFGLAIGVIRDDRGTALAIAPLVIGRTTDGPRRHLRQITFIGGIGEITSQGMDFLVPRGLESSLTPLLCQVFRSLRGEWDAAQLPMIHEDSPNLPHILTALEGFGTGARVSERQPSRFVTLPATWDDVELSHGSNWRSNHRRKWKKMTGQHSGRTLRSGADLPAAAALETLVELHARRWTKDESQFLQSRAMSFHRKLAERWIPQERLDVGVLELDGKPAAASYCFNHDGRAWFYQAGWNADYTSISIGKLAVAWAVQCAIGRGLNEFDFLPGDYGYKQEWSNGVRHLVNIEAFNPLSPRAVIFRGLRFCKNRTASLSPTPANTTANETGS